MENMISLDAVAVAQLGQSIIIYSALRPDLGRHV